MTTPADMTLSRRKAEVLGRVLVEGDLSAVPLPDVLSFMSMIRQSGKLVLRLRDLERTIHWMDGEIVFATSNSREHSLGQFLLRNGKITRQQFEESNRRVTPVLRHGKVLVMMGALSPKDLWWGVKHQVMDIVYSLFGWKEGKFVFCEYGDEAAQERITLSINTASVIMEGIRRLDEAALINSRIPDLDVPVNPVALMESRLAELELSESELKILRSVDGKRSVRELAGLSDMTDFEVKRLMFQLLAARMVDLGPSQRGQRTVFIDVEDSPDLIRIVSTFNDMFGHLYEVLVENVGPAAGREIAAGLLQNSDTDELWNSVSFDEHGRFNENLLIANISELPFEKRRATLEEGLNTLLSIQLFEVSQHLDAQRKVELFRFVSDQKSQLE